MEGIVFRRKKVLSYEKSKVTALQHKIKGAVNCWSDFFLSFIGSDTDFSREVTSWIPDESESPVLYKNSKDTPFFHRGSNPDISLDDVIDILLIEHSHEYVCMKQPMHVQQNAVFLINTSAVRLQDLPTDENGTYRNNATRVWTYEVQRKADGEP